MLVNDKVVLIFGGNGGIGKCTVLELFKNNVKGVIVADLIETTDPSSGIFIKTNVTNIMDVKNAYEFAVAKYGAIDVVINCVGVVDEINYATNITINLIGATHIINEAYNYLPKYKSPSLSQAVIVNLASTAGLAPLENFPIYCASKTGAIAFGYCMGKHKEMEGDLSVKIITLCPSATDTPMLNYGRNLCETTSGDVQTNMIRIFKTAPPQKPESVAKCILHIIEHGQNASVWMSKKDNDAQLIDYDAIHTLARSLVFK